MSTKTITRHGVELAIPIGCEIIDRDFTFGQPLSAVLMYHYPRQNKIYIICECINVYSEYNPQKYGTDGYTYFVKYYNN